MICTDMLPGGTEDTQEAETQEADGVSEAPQSVSGTTIPFQTAKNGAALREPPACSSEHAVALCRGGFHFQANFKSSLFGHII